jgi:hypothetical protein
MRYPFVLLVIFFFITPQIIGQKITFKKSDLRVKEPHKKDEVVDQTKDFNVNLDSDKDSVNCTLIISKESTLDTNYFKIITTSNIKFLDKKSLIKIKIVEDTHSDKDHYLILKLNDKNNEQIAMDTFWVENTYPFTAELPENNPEWNDGKRADIFIGTNFDFIDSKVTLTDWYGGVRLFLPNITNLGTNNSKNPNWGFAGGIYHNKSLSNFGNGQQEPTVNSYYRVSNNYLNTNGDTLYTLRYDTLRVKSTSEINNWGFYFSPIYQISHYVSPKQDFVTNIFLGLHTEVIRRNYNVTFSNDTLGFRTETVNDTTFHKHRSQQFNFIRQNETFSFYDAYFGLTLPIQFLWKDILEAKITPGVGIGSAGNSGRTINVLKYYMFQFDLLAKLGGLSLNIGGEIRGYFPNQSPIITAYLGTAFSISKIKDFLTK